MQMRLDSLNARNRCLGDLPVAYQSRPDRIGNPNRVQDSKRIIPETVHIPHALVDYL